MANGIKLLVFFVLATSFLAPAESSFAQLCDTIDWLECSPTGPQSGQGVIDIITNLTNWLFIGFMMLAVAILILAAWQFLAAGGDPQGMGKARSKLLWAVIAIAIAVVAGGIPVVVKFVLGV